MIITIGGRNLTTEDFRAVVFDKTEISLEPQALEIILENFKFLEEFSKNKII